ncbi:hypothetical protein PGB90_004327 [Kerria lacca]
MHDGSDQSTSNAHEDIDNQNRNEFTPLYTNVFDTGTLRLIIGFFFGFSVTVTIALGIQMYYGNTQVVVHGSVVSDNGQCSEIGAAIMKQGGNAVDAIIAVAFCMGIVNPHITGLGSGGLMLIYDQRQRKLLNVIDFRVTRSNHTVVGVPGFVAGLHLAHKLHGLLPWKQLVLPAEFVARTGFRVSSNLINSFSSLVKNMTNQHLKEHFSSLLLNQVMTNPDLADTLLHIATTDVAEFYNTILVDELRGFLDIEDIVNYKAFKSIGMKSSFLHYDIIVPGHGSGGSFLVNNLNLINNSLSPLVSAVEGFKTVADGWQSSVASHIATMDIADLYVTMVSGLGFEFGSQILTKSGFILNNMLEITKDETQRPTVLLTPAIALQSNKVCGRRLLLGAGDVRDAVQALISLLREPFVNIIESIESPRVRIITPKLAVDEYHKISKKDNEILSKDFIIINQTTYFPSINVIEKINDTMTAYADSRGSGYAVVF